MQQHYKLVVPGIILALAISASPFALAQSSGNFTASISQTQCTINTTPGQNGGALMPGSSTPTMMLDTYIKTPNSEFTTLLITPSLVTGLFNNTQITGAMESSANSAAVKIFVTLDGKPVAPASTASPGIIYDERFQQLSSNVFDSIAGCAMNNNCNIDLVTSTLAAHGFNFVAPNVGGGNHHLVVSWDFECTNNGTTAPCSTAYTTNTAGACAGPGSVTVTQVKAFSQSGGITVGP
ncbi:MAG TPA: hypothetical protein VNW72_06315 [Chthoniobacterales bacterium]|jgi:hypothetical protein|nr:hypothetical protein [Chthoniobacterales bacterium]